MIKQTTSIEYVGQEAVVSLNDKILRDVMVQVIYHTREGVFY